MYNIWMASIVLIFLCSHHDRTCSFAASIHPSLVDHDNLPWLHLKAKPAQPQHAAHQICNPWAGKLSCGILGLPRAAQCFAAMNADPTIDCRLPKKNALTGAILTHACTTVDSILREQGPAVYKIGYTHCPTFRMRNRLYGYVHDRHQKWQQMVVVYCSDEPVGPAFLEAALINKHKGTSSRLIEIQYVFLFDLYPLALNSLKQPIYRNPAYDIVTPSVFPQ